MKKFFVALALASAFFGSATIPTNAGEGTIIHMKPTPTPTPTPPGEDTGGRSAVKTTDEIPSFWDFLAYFGL